MVHLVDGIASLNNLAKNPYRQCASAEEQLPDEYDTDQVHVRANWQRRIDYSKIACALQHLLTVLSVGILRSCLPSTQNDPSG